MGNGAVDDGRLLRKRPTAFAGAVAVSAHAGDVSPREAWETMLSDPSAQLIDVRTRPEWMFVGMPDTREAGRDPIALEWQVFPDMQVNAGFGEALERHLEQTGASRDAPLMFLCRSGARSSAAASLMTARGWSRAYNVSGGFEGNPDENGHRGRREGWKADGLPWRQP